MEYVLSVIKSEVFITVISGVFVFVISEWLMNFIINPKKEYSSLKERIIYTISMYSCYYSNPYKLTKKENVRNKEEYDEASKELRKIGSELAGYLGNIKSKRKRKKLEEVKSSLISLSNGLYEYPNYSPIQDNKECEKNIKINLGIIKSNEKRHRN